LHWIKLQLVTGAIRKDVVARHYIVTRHYIVVRYCIVARHKHNKKGIVKIPINGPGRIYC